MSKTIYLVFESGEGYGESFNAFTTHEKALAHFKGVCEAESEWDDLNEEQQKAVLEAEEFRYNGESEVAKIVPLSVD